MSKKIKTIQTENKTEFDDLVNNLLSKGWELVKGSYSIINENIYSQVLTKDDDNYTNTEYYENGNLKSKGEYINRLKEGEWITYYENGLVESIEKFTNGISEGDKLHYEEDGSLCCKRVMIKGKEIKWLKYYKSGKLYIEINDGGNGEVRTYYESGNIECIGNWKDEEPNGTQTFYKDDERLSMNYVEEYKNGKLVDSKKINGKTEEIFEIWNRIDKKEK